MNEEELQWYIEADKRGLLKGEDKTWFDEVKRRGLAPGAESVAPPSGGDDDELMSAGDLAGDVAKSAGTGLLKGAVGLGTLPGNLEKLGRIGINRAAGLFGAKPLVDENYTGLVNYDDLMGRIEGKFGKLYKPKSTLGEYTQTAAEFLPNAIGGPATLGGRTAAVLGPAVLSETAGQMTKGEDYEGLARFVGAVGGAFTPNMLARARSPVRADLRPEQARAIQGLENEGVTSLTAGQRTGSKKLRFFEEATDWVPFSGSPNQRMADEANRQYTRAALRRAGINADSADDTVLGPARRAIGNEYENLAVRSAVPADATFVQRLENIANRYERGSSPAGRVPLIRQLVNEATERAQAANLPGGTGNAFTGREYQNWRSEILAAARSTQDPATRNALQQTARAMEAQMIRSAPPGQRAAVRAEISDLNRRYRNMKAITRAAGKGAKEGAEGVLSSARLKSAMSQGPGSAEDFALGRGDFAHLARFGEQIMKPLPSSGTAERTNALKWMNGENLRNLLGPAGAAGVMVDPVTTAITGGVALGGSLAFGGASRALMSRPVQNWLSNQQYANGVPYFWQLPADQRNLLMMTQAHPAISQLAQSRTPLTGSQGGLTADQLEEEEQGAFAR